MATTTLTLYVRARCHLCDVARGELAREFARELASGRLAINECDVDTDPHAYQRYSDLVPALVANGKTYAYWCVEVDQVRAQLAADGLVETGGVAANPRKRRIWDFLVRRNRG